MIAHVGGAPVEEILAPVVSGVGATVLMAWFWASSRVRRPRRGRRHRPRDSGR